MLTRQGRYCIQDTPYETIAGVIFGPQTHIKQIAILIQSIVREISLLHSKQSYICITHNDLSLQFPRQHGNKRNIYEEQTLYFRFPCVSKFTSLISKVSIYVIWFSQHHQKGICPDGQNSRKIYRLSRRFTGDLNLR